jgi:hypothetical protein
MHKNIKGSPGRRRSDEARATHLHNEIRRTSVTAATNLDVSTASALLASALILDLYPRVFLLPKHNCGIYEIRGTRVTAATNLDVSTASALSASVLISDLYPRVFVSNT